MWRYITGFLLIMFIGPVMTENTGAGDAITDDWALVSAEDKFWIRTINSAQHTLSFSYHKNKAQFILVLKKSELKKGNLLFDKKLSISLQVDQGIKRLVRSAHIENDSDKIVVQIDIEDAEINTCVSQMINGLAINVFFTLPSGNDSILSQSASFSLRGFTIAFNDLMIVDETGSLDPVWLLRHNKDRELYCLLTTEISIKVMQHRLDGESYENVLHMIPETGYSIIDHNLGEIIEQVYNIPQKNIAYVPRAEKYLMFSNCMANPF